MVHRDLAIDPSRLELDGPPSWQSRKAARMANSIWKGRIAFGLVVFTAKLHAAARS